MENRDIFDRTYNFALRVIKLVSSLPHNKVCEVIGNCSLIIEHCFAGRD